jgi:hypothetical protein
LSFVAMRSSALVACVAPGFAVGPWGDPPVRTVIAAIATAAANVTTAGVGLILDSTQVGTFRVEPTTFYLSTGGMHFNSDPSSPRRRGNAVDSLG